MQSTIGLVLCAACLLRVMWEEDMERLWELTQGLNLLHVLAVNASLTLSLLMPLLRGKVLTALVRQCGAGGSFRPTSLA